MQSRGAVLWGVGQPWSIEEYEVDHPGPGEVLVEWRAGGLCHSDEHVKSGDRVLSEEALAAMGFPPLFPCLCGHEGAGVVTEVGAGVTSLAEGDHVSATYLSPCGRCRYCGTGRQYLCETLKRYLLRGQLNDGVVRHRIGDNDLQVLSKLGTFSERSVVAEQSIVKVDADIPFPAAAIVSCGVGTGWGAAVERAGTRPGDVVIVVGVGGLGISAVQGARSVGAGEIVAVDPVEGRRQAAVKFGATRSAESLVEADAVVKDLTSGRGADRVIITVGFLRGDLLHEALTATARGGTCVLAGLGRFGRTPLELDLSDFATANKELKGTMFGSLNPTEAIPRLLDLYRRGLLNLDDMVTTYALDDINDGYQAMRDGHNIRGVVLMNGTRA
jgi:NDMA-dependent alcohol dehydrogenase